MHGIEARSELLRGEARRFVLDCTRFSLEAEVASADDASSRVPPLFRRPATRAVHPTEVASAGVLARLVRSTWASLARAPALLAGTTA